MEYLNEAELNEIGGGYFSSMARFFFSSVGSGMLWDGVKAGGGEMIGLDHNATSFGAATNRI